MRIAARLGVALTLAALVGYGLLERRSRWPEPIDPIVPYGESVVPLDFSSPFSLDPPPDGWWAQTLPDPVPMEVEFVEVDSTPGLQCRTDDSGSIFGRFTEIPVSAHPILSWK